MQLSRGDLVLLLDGFLALHMQIKDLLTVFRAEPAQRLNQTLSTSQLSLICRFALRSLLQ